MSALLRHPEARALVYGAASLLTLAAFDAAPWAQAVGALLGAAAVAAIRSAEVSS